MKALSKRLINKYFLKPIRELAIRKRYENVYYLHEYSSYEEYASSQVNWNNQKIDNIWADEATLLRVKEVLFREFPEAEKLVGICHGSRNGFEQKYLRSLSGKFDVIGTDISETANDFENSVTWDFHDSNDDWTGKQDFVYTNSLDQSWQPKVALQTWLAQLKLKGLLIIEHTKHHGPSGASKMDPFGVTPQLLPYVLTMWFGSQISISHSVGRKSNFDTDAWLFVIKKNQMKIHLNEI